LVLLAGGASLASAQASERVAAPVPVTGVVFVDRNNNGTRDAGEPGVAGVSVSDQVRVTATDNDGRFSFAASGYGYVFVTQPDGFAVRGPYWRRVEGTEVTFPVSPVAALRAFTFVQASDTHISEQNVERTRRLKAMVDSLKPAFVIITGDLIRDALRVPEAEARGYYELLTRELATFTVPVYTVPGNHDIFGIERHLSLVGRTNPVYGKRLHRTVRGPNYYSFNFGGVHFMGLDTVDYDDLAYYGHVDSVQVEWMKQDVARLPAGMRVVTFNHIPLVTAAETIDGMRETEPAPTVIRLGGRAYFRHVVQNTEELVEVLGDRLEIALGGHMHRREQLRYETASGSYRFYQTAAITLPVRGDGRLGIRSGITLYRVSDGHVDDGTFIPLEK
jgi:UDP-2,3-diacylglucosamine pyrophosphatase LpxH